MTILLWCLEFVNKVISAFLRYIEKGNNTDLTKAMKSSMKFRLENVLLIHANHDHLQVTKNCIYKFAVIERHGISNPADLQAPLQHTGLIEKNLK